TTHLSQLQADATVDAARFVGVDEGGGAVGLLAALPTGAAPAAPLGDGSVDAAFAAARSNLRAAGAPTSAPGNRAGAGEVVTAVLLTILFAGLVAWIVLRLVAAARQRRQETQADAQPPTTDASEPPDDLEPALAGLVVGGTGPGERSLVAGALLA